MVSCAGPVGHEMDFVVSGFNKEVEQDLAAQAEVLYEVMNSMEKLVCSTTMTDAPWSHSRVLGADAADLKQTSGKDMMSLVSASVVQALSRKRLVDGGRD